MLEIKKGKSSQSYENEFFRQFSYTLSQLFEVNNWKGLLLGMPNCITREDLQIDALLITDNSIIIIDFKDYKGEVILPNEDQFEYGRWLTENNVIIKGGSSPNPFKQIGKQRIKLIEELKYRLNGFNRKSIYTLVCFQNEMKVIGAIPGKYKVGFGIVDNHNYVNKIFDILDTLDKGYYYLTENSRVIFDQIVFNTEKYDIKNGTTEVAIPTFTTSEKYTGTNKEILDKIASFFESKSKILILTGTIKSGKTSMIPQIRELSFEKGFVDSTVFAYSNRSRKNMLKENPELEDIESLYSTIFDFQDEQIDEHYKRTIPLKQTDPEREINEKLYIIDDSQLISNSNIDSELLKFGTGNLLDDVLTFINLEKNNNSKVIFMGDKNKLSYGSKIENALNPAYLESLLSNKNIYSEIVEVELENVKTESEIVKACQKIASHLSLNQFNELMISSKQDIHICGKSDGVKALQETYENPENNRIIVYTNKQANHLNRWIKEKYAKNGVAINTGDFVVFHYPTFAYAPSEITYGSSPFEFGDQPFDFVEPKKIENGMFGEIIYIDNTNILIEKASLKNSTTVEITFIPCQVKLQDGIVVELLIFNNFLTSSTSELSTNEIIAYQIILSDLEKEEMAKEPFEQTEEYAEMIQNGDYIRKMDEEGKLFYRNIKDQRKMTKYEKDYRKRILSRLMIPESKYFKLLSAAKVKFAWCMTVNRAMAYHFDNVFFNTEQGENRGRANADYFKWLYTGISIGRNQVNLINWKPISPFMLTEFNTEPPTNMPKSNNIIMTASNGIEQIGDELRDYLTKHLTHIGGIVLNIASKQYLEVVTIKLYNEEVQMLFDYNKRGEIKIPRLNQGNQESFQTILKSLEHEDKGIPDEVGEMKNIFVELIMILSEKEIQTKVIALHDWSLIFEFSNLDEYVNVQVWYSGKGMISKFNYLQGSLGLFKNVLNIIQTTYGIEEGE